MKKLSLLFILAFLLMGCSSKTITNMKQEDINQIIFAMDSHEYQIREDKFEEVYNVLQEEYVSKEEIEGIDKTHRMILKGEYEEVFYIQNNGTIIKHEKDRYYRYTFENDSLLNLYKKILGNDIFYGEIVLNKNYVDNYEENDVIFNIDSNDVLEITVGSHGKSFLLKQEKIEDFVDLLNHTTYFEMDESGLYGYAQQIHLYFKDRQYWFQFSGIEGCAFISFSTKEDLNNNESEEFVTFELKNDNFYHLLQEIMGEHSLQLDKLQYDPSYEWVEKIEDGKTNIQVICERSELDFCEFE